MANPTVQMKELTAELEQLWLRMVAVGGHAAAVQALGLLLASPPPVATLSTWAAVPSSSKALPAAATATVIALQQPPSPRDDHIDSVGPSPRTSLDVSNDMILSSSPLSRLGGSLGGSARWKKAFEASHKVIDPWASRSLHLLPMEHCVRHRYNPATRQWVTDDVLIKMEGRPFAAGAMRECYAMKKLSTFTTSVYHDWKKAQNCVAKRYKKEVPKDIYHTDVLVQMDAKLMGEMYNRTDPPKKVDIMQAAIVEFPDRPNSPLYCIEQLMEGDYIKYNSNSGFVLGDDLLRHTPQAFSHFTYEWSKGQRICIDIQGVGDLYTDPQIHTLDGEGYGEGNLGARGMALFFRTHECNPLCARLGLKPFHRCPADIKAQGYSSTSASVASARNEPGAMRTLVKRPSINNRLAAARLNTRKAGEPHSQAELRRLLDEVPTTEPPEAVIHYEAARVYAEVVLLPELRPAEDPEDALAGGLFHFYQAARLGGVLPLVLVAVVHAGGEPLSTALAHLIKVGRQRGDVFTFPDIAWRAAVMAAERGVAAAAASVAHGYATGQGLADGILEEAQPAEAARWYKRALELSQQVETIRQAAEAGEEAHEADMQVQGAEAGPETPPAGVVCDPERVSGPFFSHPDPSSTSSSRAGTVERRSSGGGAAGGKSMQRRVTTSSESGTGTITLQLPALSKGPSQRFLRKQRLAAEDEAAAGLPHSALEKYEMQAALGKLLMEGVPEPDCVAAAELLNEAAEGASNAGKGKLAQKYFELAAQAESM